MSNRDATRSREPMRQRDPSLVFRVLSSELTYALACVGCSLLWHHRGAAWGWCALWAFNAGVWSDRWLRARGWFR